MKVEPRVKQTPMLHERRPSTNKRHENSEKVVERARKDRPTMSQRTSEPHKRSDRDRQGKADPVNKANQTQKRHLCSEAKRKEDNRSEEKRR